MAKDPAFLFYSQDFFIGTALMTDEQVGRYIRLLCLHHQKGRLREQDMLIVCKTYDKEVFDKFEKDDQGNYFNARLEAESGKRKAFSESRRKARLSGITKKSITSDLHTSNISKSQERLTENEIENENVIEIRKESSRENQKRPFEIAFDQAFDEITLERYAMQFKELKIDEELKEFKLKCINNPGEYSGRDSGGLRTAFQYHLRNAKNALILKRQQRRDEPVDLSKIDYSKTL